MCKVEQKFAIISHILPPSPSGQGMVLFRLLNGLSTDMYCLVSRENYEAFPKNSAGSEKLPVRYYSLKPIFQFPALNLFKLSFLSILINVLLGIYGRAKQIE